MEDDREKHEPVHNGYHSSDQILLFLGCGFFGLGEQVTRMLDIEHSTDAYDLLAKRSPCTMTGFDLLTDWPEIAHEERFFPVFDTFWHEAVGKEDCRDTPEDEDKKAEDE